MIESYWDSIEKAYDEVSIYDGPKVFEDNLKKFSPEIGDLLATHWFLSELSNGGMAQFLENPTAVVADRAVLAFSNFDLPEVATALRRGIEKANESPEILSPTMFEEEERVIYSVGGSDLGRIYDCLDAFANKMTG